MADDATALEADASAGAGNEGGAAAATDAGAQDAGQGGGSAADDKGADKGGKVADDGKVAANDDWRTTFATDEKGEPDAALLKFLGRYHSPQAAIAAWKKNNDEIASGKFVKPLGDDPTDDELASYRKDFGIPDEPKGYMDKLPDGLVVGEDDKPFVDKFLTAMHATNAPPTAVNAALDTYYSLVQEQESKRADDDREAMNEGIEDLRGEWGADYKRNLTAAHSFLDGLPASVQQIFRNGRLPVLDADGKPTNDTVPIGYNPDAMRWLTSLALEANPAVTVVPGGGSNQVQAIADEIADIEKQMGNPTSDYWKGPKSENMQARYRELVGAREKLSAKG